MPEIAKIILDDRDMKLLSLGKEVSLDITVIEKNVRLIFVKEIKMYTCPDCGGQTDGKSAHLTGVNHVNCLTVLGRRGWRKLGEYDG